MKGSMRERGPNTWQLRVHAGHGRYVSKTFHGTKRAAENALADLITKTVGGRVVGGSGRTVSRLLNAWHDSASADWSPAVVRDHRHIIDKRIAPELGSVRLSRLTTADIDAFYARLRRRYAPGTVRRTHGALHSALAQAVRWEWIGVNPATGARVPAQPEREPTVPTAVDLERVVDQLGHYPDMAMYVHLAAITGARRGQLCALRWSNIDLDGRTATFTRTISRAEGGQSEPRQIGRKKGTQRRIALPAVTVELLRAHRQRQVDIAEQCGTRLSPRGFVFTRDPQGLTAWRLNTVTDAWGRIRERAGLEGVRLHDLRHWAATTMIAAGVDPRTAAGRLGHRNPATTLAIYSAFVPASDQDAADLLAAILTEARTGQS